MKLLNPPDKNKFVTDTLKKEPLKYLFNVVTGEISEEDKELFNDFNNDWFYLYENEYPVYKNGVYVGSFWYGEYRTREEFEADKL